MKTPIEPYQRCMVKVSYFQFITLIFPCDCGDQKSFQRPTKKPEPTMALISYIGLYCLLDCDCLLKYQVGMTAFYYLFYNHMPLAIVIFISAFQWITYNPGQNIWNKIE